MCGIYGYFDRSHCSQEAPDLLKMASSLHHRGPDDAGEYHQSGVALGNLRLSIVDIEGGHQPFIAENNDVVVVQNGEIYNHVELREQLKREGVEFDTHSDTEVILKLYLEKGIDFLSMLNGMFSIAIYDKNKDCLFVARDRIGVKPLFYHDDGQRFLFASEIKSLLSASVPATISNESLSMFLAYNYVPPPVTIFKNIFHVEPGTYLRISNAGVDKVVWWDLLSIEEDYVCDEKDWQDSICDLLNEAVGLRMRCDVPYGAFLSGGLDSSSVIACMEKHTDNKVNSYSIGFNDRRYDESGYAIQAAKRFNSNLTLNYLDENLLPMWPMVTYYNDQPHGDVSFLPTYMNSKFASNDVKVVLTGDGGDELFAGYTKYQSIAKGLSDVTSDIQFLSLLKNNMSLFSDESRCKLLLNSSELKGFNPWYQLNDILLGCESMSRINQMLMVDMVQLLPGNNLVKPDRMSMATSLEARTPFLDYRMVELAFRIPGYLKLKNNETKYILKKAVSPLIGEDLAYRDKQMFTVPVGEWFKGRFAKQIKELLLSKASRVSMYMNADYIREMIDDHVKGRRNYTRQIRALVAFEIWHKIYLEGEYNVESQSLSKPVFMQNQ